MLIKPRVIPTDLKVWPNRHNTFKQAIDNLLELRNGNWGNVLDDYNAATKIIQDLIGKAIKAKLRLRALGGVLFGIIKPIKMPIGMDTVFRQRERFAFNLRTLYIATFLYKGSSAKCRWRSSVCNPGDFQ